MIYLLLKWPDVDTAVECGQLLGTTSTSEDEVNKTAPVTNGINLAVIGTHSYVSDDSDPENPVTTSVPGHWVMAWCRDGFPIDTTLSKIPSNLQPEIVWRSDAVDEEGEPLPRPPVNIAPQHRVA